jgi:ATP-dependent helicase/nuclease subunit A
MACVALIESNKSSDNERGVAVQNWLDSTPEERTKNYQEYKSHFITTKNTIKSKLTTKGVINANPDVLTILEIEAARIYSLEQSINALNIANISRDIFMIGEQVLHIYEKLKEKEAALDFDDLILKTLNLLKGNTPQFKGLENSAAWVRFKLDQGIDHILLDEAQDTNPEQWEILEALCGDFFDGEGASDQARTLFVVGDEKQSIYSFQRASPEKFTDMQRFFTEKIQNAQKQFQNINFNISFRSTQPVLKLVDQIFSHDDISQGLGLEAIHHESFRRTQAGMVELWPLFQNPEKQDADPWALPVHITESTSGAAQMASHVGDTIQGWLDNKEILESYDRPIMPGDIMILVRSRTAFLDQLVRALKIRDIPVNGIDRMVLNDQLVIQDLCAVAQFALLPEDDLTLAALLKSPFIGWTEDQLYNVAYDRKGSLWAEIQKSDAVNTIKWLSNLISFIGHAGTYEFFIKLLQSPCPANNISGLRAIKKRLGEETIDPIEAFLDQAANYDHQSIATLQNFIQDQLHQSSQIKREMDEAGNSVRIMTVHAAKGLQAPIVILPDTVRTGSSNKPDQLLWPDRTGAVLPYFCPQSKDVPPPCEQALAVLKQRQSEEYRRLLYVALTRAESRLYVGGYKASQDPIDESWYRYVEHGFDLLETTEEIGQNDVKVKRYVHHATSEADRADHQEKSDVKKAIELPDWIFQKMPEEPSPAKPLMPSRPSEDENVTALSPLQAKDNHRFLRGNITHKLLQILPDIPPSDRKTSAGKYVALKSHDIAKNVQQSIVEEVMEILDNPDFAAIFGEGSVAEAPITGMLDNNRIVSGQIDRLLVTEKEILIIDYKSNRPAPQNVEDVPTIYHKQMKAYADLMGEIYPNRSIRCALIWTDGAKLMELPDI